MDKLGKKLSDIEEKLGSSEEPPYNCDDKLGWHLDKIESLIGGGSGGGNVDDVKVNGTSVVSDKVANIKLKTINDNVIEGEGNITISADLSNVPTLTENNVYTGLNKFATTALHKPSDSDIDTWFLYSNGSGLELKKSGETNSTIIIYRGASGAPIMVNNGVRPFSGNTYDLGINGVGWKDLYLSGKLKDGTNQVAINEITKTSLLADAYDSTATYNVGDICVHGSGLYQCKVQISSAEAWTAAHWDSVTVASLLVGSINSGY